jgi:oligopeptide transport system substrate-binding protein
VGLATAYVSLNTRDNTAFKDKRVRQALSLAIDREFMTSKLLRAGQVPAYAFVPPGVSNYVTVPGLPFAATPYPERVAQAKRLLAQAGYGPDNPLTFEIKTANNTDSMLLAESAQADWIAMGAKVALVQNESQIAFAAYRARDFDVGMMTWYADYNDPVTFLDLFRSSTGAQNYGDYKNPAYDALLGAAAQEPDAGKRAAILGRAEQTLLDDVATIPIYFVVNRALVNPRVTGFVDNPDALHRVRFMCFR